jgi:hypothetical protein
MNAIAGFARGAIGSVWGGLMATGLITAFKIFTPELWRSALNAIGGQKLADKAAKTVKEEGIPGVLKDSAMEGFGLMGLWGGAKGMVESTNGQSTEGSGGLGTILGTGVVMAVVGSVVIGAMNKNGVKPAGEADGGAKQPASTPAATKADSVAPKK